MIEVLLAISAAMGVLHTVVSVLHLTKLDALGGAALDKMADSIVARAKATPDTSDDGIAAAEANIIRAAAKLVQDPATISKGLDLLDGLAKRKLG
ncbi:MAG TPA: hypothetical protein VGO62_09725 [Myxococcota bacterium]